MDIGVKNDDLLIRMTTIVQRALQAESNGDDSFGISQEEKDQLLSEINKIADKNKK